LWYEFHIYAKNNDNANKIAKDFFHITADIEHTKEIPNVSVNNEMELLQKNMKKLIEENETLSNRNIFLNKKVDVLENLNKTYKEKLDEQNKDKKFFSE
jgi:guanylate kinase